MAPFIIVATLTAAPGNADKIQAHLSAVKAEVEKNEPGTLQYQTCRGVEDDHLFTIFEEYESVAAQEAHREGAAYKAFKAEVASLWASPLQLHKMNKF
ncbi:hypothetical protein P7C73_g1628, partial [Tremellales sp. Uapishka_1]